MENIIFSMNQVTHYFDDGEQGKNVPQLGWYAGGGVAFAVGSHHLYVDASYSHSFKSSDAGFKYLPQTITATIGWMF